MIEELKGDVTGIECGTNDFVLCRTGLVVRQRSFGNEVTVEM